MVIKVAMPERFQLKMVPGLSNIFMKNAREVHYLSLIHIL